MKGRRSWDMRMINGVFRRRGKEKRHLKHCIKENLCNGFLIRKALCKVRLCCEYHIMPQLRSRDGYQQFDRGRIVANRECGFSFRAIVHRIGRHPSTVIRIWNEWLAEHAEQHIGSQSLPMTNIREHKHKISPTKPCNHITDH